MRNVTTTSMVLVMVMALAAGSAMADMIYSNDFGTTAQVQEFTKWAGTRNLQFGPVGTIPYPAVGFNYIQGQDIDGDGLAHAAALADDGVSAGWYEGRLVLEAPEGYYFNNPIFNTGWAGGRSNQTNFVSIGLSKDGGANFLVDDTRNHGAGAVITKLGLDTTGDTDWTELTSITLQMKLATFYNEPPYYTYQGVVQNLAVYADVVAIPEPATMSLLCLGGLAIVIRRKK